MCKLAETGSSRPLIRTRRHDVSETPGAFLSLSGSLISPSAELFGSDTHSFKIHAHCSYTHTPEPLHRTPPLPQICNFGERQHKICLHRSILLSANAFLLPPCIYEVTSRAGCHLFRRRHSVCSLSSSCLFTLSSVGMR